MIPVAEVRHEQHVCEIVDLAIQTLVVNLGISGNEAARVLFIASGKTLTPGAINDAVRTINVSRKGMPVIG